MEDIDIISIYEWIDAEYIGVIIDIWHDYWELVIIRCEVRR